MKRPIKAVFRDPKPREAARPWLHGDIWKGREKAVFRVSCLVFRENPLAGLDVAPQKAVFRVSCFVKTRWPGLVWLHKRQ